jgi:hypothetical protein
MTPRTICTAWLLALLSSAPQAQDAKTAPPEAGSGMRVVPYCIEPMDSMPAKIRALIEPQFLCAAGTHLKRDSRTARVVPTGEESSGRPFVLRFGPPETANAWFVRGFATEPQR